MTKSVFTKSFRFLPKLTTFSAFLALSLGLAAPAQAGQGWTVVEQLLGSFQVKTGKDLNNRAASCIDYQEMSCRCLGKRDWDALTAAQKKLPPSVKPTRGEVMARASQSTREASRVTVRVLATMAESSPPGAKTICL